MAENRKSATQAAARRAARERAAERAAEFRRRQDQLEELAASYFVAMDSVESIEGDADERIAAIRSETEQKVEASRAEAAGIIGRMLDTKVSRDEVAARLGIPVKDVKRVKRVVDADIQPTPEDTTNEQRNESESSDVGENADTHYDKHTAA